MFNLWKGVQLGGHTQLQSEVLESQNLCIVLRSEETHVKSYRRGASQLSLRQNLYSAWISLTLTAYNNAYSESRI